MNRFGAILVISGLSAASAAAQEAQEGSPETLFEMCGGTAIVMRPEVAFVDDAAERGILRQLEQRIASVAPGLAFVAGDAEGRIVVNVVTGADLENVRSALLSGAALAIHAVVAEDGVAFADREGAHHLLSEKPAFTQADFANVTAVIDATGAPVIEFTFTPEASLAFAEWTAARVGARIALVLDGTIVSMPVLRSAMTGGTGQIADNFTEAETHRIARGLRFGPLDMPMRIVRETQITLAATTACPVVAQ